MGAPSAVISGEALLSSVLIVLDVRVARNPHASGPGLEGCRLVSGHGSPEGDKVRCSTGRTEDLGPQGGTGSRELVGLMLRLVLMVVGKCDYMPAVIHVSRTGELVALIGGA